MTMRGSLFSLLLAAGALTGPVVAEDALTDVEQKIAAAFEKLTSYTATTRTVAIYDRGDGTRQRSDYSGTTEFMRDGDKFLSHTVTTSTTTVLPGEDATEEELERGGKQVDEEKVTTVCDGEAMWMYFEKGEQKGITKQATPLASNWEPTAAFASYRNFYEFTLDREDEHEGAACWVLKLAQVVPEGAPPTGDTELWYRQDCGLLVKSIVTDGTGAPMTTTVVSDLKLGEEIDRERFSFTPPEGIPVNDHTGAGGGN